MFEHQSQPLISRRAFAGRVVRCTSAGGGLVAASLAAGMAGYHWFEHLPWLDAYLNAAMLLSGMGPLTPPQTVAGKVFAGLYALYSGLLLIMLTGLVLGPVFHRFLHKFHLAGRAP